MQKPMQREQIEKQREESEQKALNYTQTMDAINQSWSTFQNQVGDFVKMIADSGNVPEGVSDLFALKAVDGEGNTSVYGSGEAYYAAMAMAQKGAVDNQRNVNRLENELFEKKAEYSDAVAGKAPALPEKAQEAPAGK